MSQQLSKHQQEDITSLLSYASHKGLKNVSVTFERNLIYPNRLESLYTLTTDSERLSGTYQGIMFQLANKQKIKNDKNIVDFTYL